MKHRLMTVCVSGVALVCLLMVALAPAHATSPIVVNSVADPGDGVCDDRECTLREAIATAPAGGRIELALPGGSKIALSAGELVIDKDLAIAGSPVYPGISVDAGRKSRVFSIKAGNRVEIVGLRITQGDTYETGQQGGGIWNDGLLTLDHVQIEYNHAVAGPVDGEGGGIFNQGSVVLRHSIVRRNWSALGGGIANRGEMFIDSSQILNNGASARRGGGAGGVFSSGMLVMQESMIAHNWAPAGAGIYNQGALTLRRTAVFSNTAEVNYAGSYGGLFNSGIAVLIDSAVVANRAVDFGAGIASGGNLTLINTTVSGNYVSEPRSPGSGGGISMYGLEEVSAPTVTLYHSTITDNSPSGLYVNADVKRVQAEQVILAGNGGGARDCVGVNLLEQWHTGGHNLVGSETGCPFWSNAGDKPVDSTAVFTTVLAPLPANDDEPSWASLVHALLPTSPAVDGGEGRCEDTQGHALYSDQRGAPRPVDGDGDGLALCDPGAYEFDPAPTLTPTPAPTPVPSPYTLLSTKNDGQTANGQWSLKDSSDDGRFVVFEAELDCSTPPQVAMFPHIFVLDRAHNHMSCIERDVPGETDVSIDFHPSIRSDGSMVVFDSVVDVTLEVFLYDMRTGKSSLVPFSKAIFPISTRPTISDDGRYVAIMVPSSFIDAEYRCQTDTGIYFYDFVEERVLCAAEVAPPGSARPLSFPSSRVLLSRDNRIAGYADDGGTVLHDLISGQKWRAFHESYDGYRLYAVFLQDMSADAGYALFTSIYESLEGSDTIMNTYVYDRSTESTQVLTHLDGFYTDWSIDPYQSLASISDDGRFIAFYSEDADLVAGDTNGEGDIFVYDQVTHRLEAMPALPGWMVPDGASGFPLLTANAGAVVFQSLAHNLAGFDRNDEWDVYSYQRSTWSMLWLPMVERQ